MAGASGDSGGGAPSRNERGGVGAPSFLPRLFDTWVHIWAVRRQCVSENPRAWAGGCWREPAWCSASRQGKTRRSSPRGGGTPAPRQTVFATKGAPKGLGVCVCAHRTVPRRGERRSSIRPWRISGINDASPGAWHLGAWWVGARERCWVGPLVAMSRRAKNVSPAEKSGMRTHTHKKTPPNLLHPHTRCCVWRAWPPSRVQQQQKSRGTHAISS